MYEHERINAGLLQLGNTGETGKYMPGKFKKVGKMKENNAGNNEVRGVKPYNLLSRIGLTFQTTNFS